MIRIKIVIGACGLDASLVHERTRPASLLASLADHLVAWRHIEVCLASRMPSRALKYDHTGECSRL